MVFDPHGLVDRHERSQVLLMRHPQTVANAAAQYLGARNADLSELGQRQRLRAVTGLIDWAPDTIVSSPLKRCLAIAEPVAERLGIKVEVDPRIGEMDFGVLEGLTYEEAMAAGLCFPWGETAKRWPVEGAESVDQFRERLTAAGNDLREYSGRTAVVAHGGVIRGIVAIWMDIPEERLWNMTVRNVESTLFASDGEGNVFLERYGLAPEWLGSI